MMFITLIDRRQGLRKVLRRKSDNKKQMKDSWGPILSVLAELRESAVEGLGPDKDID